MSLKDYISIARPSHWFKNIFMLPGVVVAMWLTDTFSYRLLAVGLLALISVCIIASANYVINEWLDAEFDKYHPLKKNRPSVTGRIKAKLVFVEYAVLAVTGLSIAYFISYYFLAAALFLLVMGFLYNVKPFRTKDKMYMDVLSESINNPIRFALGWFVVTSAYLPPVSLLVAYWMGGAFLMAVKRYAELRFIGDRSTAVLYRRSFRFYTENNLLVSILFYAMSFAFFFGVFIIKHRIELLLSLPLFSILFGWYLSLGMNSDSPAQRPEKLYRERWFMLYILLLTMSVSLLLWVDFPRLHFFLENHFIGYSIRQ
ncbi:MAG: UbiA prenyltransferase family protein [Candidatus Magasanikbacteria bacterium]|nr:UbiA prenyltransferase family protein [Candidatus Magasanikbacteria bacterium]